MKFKTKWKGKHNIQTCSWIRASQTAQSQGCMFAFVSTLAFKKCPGGSFLSFSFAEEAVKDRELSICYIITFPTHKGVLKSGNCRPTFFYYVVDYQYHFVYNETVKQMVNKERGSSLFHRCLFINFLFPKVHHC